MPMAVDIRNAGNVVTSALPMESSAKVFRASSGERPIVRHADDDAAGQIQTDDHERCDGVALHELSGAVHRAVEVGLALYRRALPARAVGVDCAGMHVGVDRHLFAGHRIEREPRRDLGDALRSARNHDELNRNQNGKHDQPDDEIAVHDEFAECRNDGADGARRCALRKNQARRRHVERQAEKRGH